MADRKKMSAAREKMLEKMRKKVAEKKAGGRDPDEFRPESVKPGQTKDYYFYILAPNEGEDLWYVENGAHWIDKRPYSCPRINDEESCPVCQLGFDLMDGVEDKKARSKIGRKFLPNTRYAINILFTDDKDNGEYANKVMWYNAPATVIKKTQDAFVREDAGDNKKKPHAFGDFFAPEASYIFNLSISEKSDYNNYDASDFLAHSGTQEIPEVVSFEKNGKTVEGDPLDFRIDLRSKIDPVNMQFLNDYVEKMENGPSSQFEDEDGDDGDTVTESSAKSEPETTVEKKTEAKTEAKTEKPKEEPKEETPVEASAEADSSDEEQELEDLLNELT